MKKEAGNIVIVRNPKLQLGAVRHADAAIVTAEFKLPFETLTQAALKLH